MLAVEDDGIVAYSVAVSLGEGGVPHDDPRVRVRLDLGAADGALTLRRGPGGLTCPLRNVAAPVHPDDAASKAYVDGIARGLSVRGPCAAATDAPLALGPGPPPTVVDGVPVAPGDRVLCLGQPNPIDNGIYVVATAGRAPDLADGTLAEGVHVWVRAGVRWGDRALVCVGDGAGRVGVDPLRFVPFGDPPAAPGFGLLRTVDEAADAARVRLAVDPAAIATLARPGGNVFTQPNVFDGHVTFRAPVRVAATDPADPGAGSAALTVDGGVAVAGDVVARATYTLSDARLKRGIRPLAGALAAVRALRGRAFTWAADGRPDVGFLAQEVAHVAPQCVAPAGPDGHLAVDYARLVPYLVEAVKALDGHCRRLRRALGRRSRLRARTKKQNKGAHPDGHHAR